MAARTGRKVQLFTGNSQFKAGRHSPELGLNLRPKCQTSDSDGMSSQKLKMLEVDLKSI